MSRGRRVASSVAVAALAVGGGVLTAPLPPAAAGGQPPIGHLAYVTTSGKVDVVTLNAKANTVRRREIGPVTTPAFRRRVAVRAFVASGDGHWVAWSEAVTKRDGTPTGASPRLVLHGINPGALYTLRTAAYPIGFAGDTLVTYDGTQTSQFVLDPNPHLEAVPSNGVPIATYGGGTIGVTALGAPPGPRHTAELSATAFNGATGVFHDYVMRHHDRRAPAVAEVSPDNAWLLVERGDHRHFGGPSSLVDAYRIGTSHSRQRLGHYGRLSQGWRVGAFAYAWSTDDAWAMWLRRGAHGAPQSVVAVDKPGGWKRIVPHGIAVAGSPQGYVIAQPGRFVRTGSGAFRAVPRGEALLMRDRFVRVLGIEGTAFAWVA